MPHVSTDDDRRDPIAGIMEVTRNAESELRSKDRILGRTLVIGRAYLASAVLIVLLAAALALPHSDGVRGFDVLFFTDVAREQYTSLPSHLFVLLYSVGGIVFGVISTTIPYAATRGQRDFASTMQLVAGRYDVLCDPKSAEKARDMLARLSG